MRRLFALTPEARKDLKGILLDIAEHNPDVAERLRTEFYDGLQLLGRSPGIGHYHGELLSRKYRFWNFYPYVPGIAARRPNSAKQNFGYDRR